MIRAAALSGVDLAQPVVGGRAPETKGSADIIVASWQLEAVPARCDSPHRDLPPPQICSQSPAAREGEGWAGAVALAASGRCTMNPGQCAIPNERIQWLTLILIGVSRLMQCCSVCVSLAPRAGPLDTRPTKWWLISESAGGLNLNAFYFCGYNKIKHSFPFLPEDVV
eukprot:554012-Prymnesium_polylepis.2